MNNYDAFMHETEKLGAAGYSNDKYSTVLLTVIGGYLARILDILETDDHKSYTQITKEAADRL